jgi:acetylserotonin N-methyltransferase
MHCHSLPAAITAARGNAFAGVSRLLDVGGGSGCFAIALAQRNPKLRCTVMDLPPVCEIARRYIADGGVSDRVEVLGLDMFREQWPTGYDGILLSNVIHDWDDETNTRLARSAFDALPSGGRLFLHELLLDERRDGPLAATAFSLVMATTTRGRQYTADELSGLLTSVGFVDVLAGASHVHHSIVSAAKP